MVEFVRFNQISIETGLHQGDLFEKFKENDLVTVNCLKLQTQANLLECFH